MIDVTRYKKRGGGHSPVMVNVRLRKAPGPGVKPPTAAEVRRVVQDILRTGAVPVGWQFAAIDWRNPNRLSAGWRSGVLHDMESFAAVLQSTLLDSRIAIVRPEPKELQHGAKGGVFDVER